MKIHLNTPSLCAFALLLVTGCSDSERTSKVNPSDQDDPINLGDLSESNDDVFAPGRVLALAIEIAPHRLEALRQKKDSHEYVTCAVREGDRSWEDVGIHCRGNPAAELATGKPDLIVTFDKFVSKQRFHGQRRLILQASREDPSYMAAPIALEMFRAAGVPAARCGFTSVQLNGRPLGLYVIIEGVEREFLERHFHKANGNLYDEGDPPDVTGKLEKARGRDRKDQSDVDALAAAALHSDPDERWKQLQQRLDVDRFLKFAALEILFWQEDSYSLDAHKFRLYHDPETDRLVFFPKCVERVLEKINGPLVPKCRGVVTHAVLNTTEGEQRYRETVARLLETLFDPVKVRARVQELAATIRPVAAADPAAAKAFDLAVLAFLDAVTRRAEFATAQLKLASAK